MEDLKFFLLDKLVSIEDEGLLNKINDLIGDINVDQSTIKVSDAQRSMLLKSEEDIKNGNLISDEELNDEEDQWLKE